MKKVLTEKLPRWKDNKYKGKINWKKCIGYKVKFIYDDIEGEIEIIDCWKKNKKTYLKIKYKQNTYDINATSFRKCQIGNILGLINHNYKYQIGDIITNINSGKLKILEQVRIKHNRNTMKGYKYKCLICKNEDIISEDHLKQHMGCNVCSNQKILIGYNDMWTTNSKLASLLANPNDGYKYTQNSGKRVDWKCPNCGNIIKNKIIDMVNKHGLSCPGCSDKLPYTEKFIFNLLKQLLQDNFIYQLSRTTFKWCKNYKYDFYFKINNESYILEINGIQHYKEKFQFSKSNKSRTLQEEQENDKLKKQLAIKNGIKENNYIVIDCRESTLGWIKEHILNSRLNNIFDLNEINWLECHEHACNSLVTEICELWNDQHEIKQITNIMKLGRTKITNCLKRGTKLGWCDYDPKKEMRKSNSNNPRNKKKVICLNNNKVFNSIKEASIYYDIKRNDISKSCKNNNYYIGVNLTTGEKLYWEYYSEIR